MMRIWQLASFVWTTFQPCLQWRSTMARSMSSASMVSSPQHNPWVSKLLSIGILCYNLSILFFYVHVQLLVCMWITKASAPGNKSWYGTPLHQTLVSSTKKKKEKTAILLMIVYFYCSIQGALPAGVLWEWSGGLWHHIGKVDTDLTHEKGTL